MGSLEYVGRIDEQVKVHGYRIEPGEVEAVLSRHAQVSQALVMTYAEAGGEGRLVAYVVSSAAGEVSGAELREYLREKLPEYMIPAYFVELEELPLSPNGKVDRGALPQPERSRAGLEKEYVGPRSRLEELLAEMWKEILRVEEVGMHDNFFELGGDSIHSAIFINHLQERLGEYVYIVAIFDAPTIAGLAEYLERHYGEAVARVCGVEQSGWEQKSGAAAVNEEKLGHFRTLIPGLGPDTETSGGAQKNGRAIFILSAPRSGSTLLRVMLAGHSGMFAPPELELLGFNSLEERRAGLSGRDSFWLEGTVRALMALSGMSSAAATEQMQEYEEQGMTVSEFYGEMQGRLGARMLVDKTPSYALDVEVLRRAEAMFAEARYIHLVRHPYGMIRSFEEARLDQSFFRYEHPYTTRELAELIWVVCEENIAEFLREVPAERKHEVKFEELVSDPRAEMEKLCEFAELEFEAGMLEPYEEKQGRMTDGINPLSKMLGDVKFHEHGGIEAAVAERWRERMRADGDRLWEGTWQLAERFGYERSRAEEEAGRRALAPIKRASREQPLALSFAQQRLWFLDQMEPGGTVYNISTALRLVGELDVAALERALSEIMRRHEVLRTTFAVVDGMPVQVIGPAEGLRLAVTELSELAEAEQEQAVAQLARASAQIPFDLVVGPLLRVQLLRLGEQEQVLLATMHHIVSDGWSMGLLISELSTLYQAYSEGQSSPLAELEIQYGDYAVWQREWLQGEVLEEQLGYWREQLAGAPRVLELSTDRPRPAVQSYRGARLPLLVELGVKEELEELSRGEGATMFMSLLAAWQVLLSRYTGMEDIVVGTPVAGRNQRETEELIGFFVNTLVLRTDLSGGPTYREVLRRVRELCLGAYAHQEVPFEKLVDELQPERALSYQPLFQVLMTLQNAPRQELQLRGLSLSRLRGETTSTKFDLTLTLEESGGALHGSLGYNTDLFEAQTIRRMAGHYQAVAHSDGARAGPAGDNASAADAARAGAVGERVEPDGAGVSGEVHARAVCRAGGAEAGGDGGEFCGRGAELWGVEPAGKSGSALSEETRSGSGDVGGDLRGAVAGDDGGAAGSAEGRGRVFAAGPWISERAVGIHAGGCRGERGAEPGGTGSASAGVG